ncbi:MAG: hypothetical protein ACI4L8_08520 [Candidatus Fimadaptatus sp.]
MKRTNLNAGAALNGLKRWFGDNMGVMRSAWSLYRAVAGRTAVFAGVLLVAPYALLVFLTMRAVDFDLGRGLQLMTGVGYAADWAAMMIGRIQAISSLSSLISYATDLFLLPCACAAFAIIFTMRWQGLALPVRDVWERVRPLVGRIFMAGIAVMFAMNLAEMLSSLLMGLLSMVAGLLGFIPVVGSVVYGIVYAASMLIMLALSLLSVTILMFTMLTMTGENGGRGQLMMATLRVLWGGRRDVLPKLAWLLAACAAVLALGGALYGILFSVIGAQTALVIMLVTLALLACAAIPLMCAFITVVYMNEYERQGGRTYIYARHD